MGKVESSLTNVEDEKPTSSTEISSGEDAAVPTTPNNGEESEPEYPTGLPFWLIMVGLCLSVFVMALDNTIIATAIPKITDRFNSLDDVAWYASSYLLTSGGFQLLFGRLYTTFPLKWVFIAALTIFEFGSLICGVTPTSVGLIVGRAIAGVGASGIMSGALLILSSITPLAVRPTYMGMIGGMYGLASVAGPLLGGVFTDKVTWRLCFLINLPIGLITAVTVLFVYDGKNEAKTAKPHGLKEYLKAFDMTGNVVFIPAVICLFLALQWGGTTYPWKSGRVIGLLVAFGVLISIFAFLQVYRSETAMVPVRLLKNRSIAAAIGFNFFVAGSFFILAFYVPIWFQAVKGESALRSGLLNLPLILTLVAASMISGVGTTAGGYYTPFLYLCTVILSIGAGMISTWDLSTRSPAYLGFQALAGIGLGLGLQVPFICVQTVLPAVDLPVGTAVVVFSQTIGGAVFVSVGQNIFTNKLVENLRIHIPDVNPLSVLATGATNIHTIFHGAQLEAVKLSYNDALTQAFLVAAILAALTVFGSLAMPWTNVKGKKKEEGVESASGTAVDGSGTKEPSANGETALQTRDEGEKAPDSEQAPKAG